MGKKKVNGNKWMIWGRQDGAQLWSWGLGAVGWWRPEGKKMRFWLQMEPIP